VRSAVRGVIGITVAAATLAGAQAEPAATKGPSCAAPRATAAHTRSVERALRTHHDVWGNRLLNAPDGPSYEAARRLLPPLFYARAPKKRSLTDSGAYYLTFAQPQGARGAGSVALHVADGPDAAKSISEQLAPYTRDAPITRPEVYEDAKRRMRAQAEGKGEASARRELEHALLVGSDVVYLRGDYLQVGQVAFRISEVREYALRGANLPLTGGRLLQAAMGLLVVAAEDRARTGEDLEALSRRIAEYEAWSGRSAGR